jgi:hypothetical protein
VATLTATSDARELGEVELVAAEDVERASRPQEETGSFWGGVWDSVSGFFGRVYDSLFG